MTGLLRAVALSGKVRPVLTLPTNGRLFDIARDGRIIIEAETIVRQIEAKPAAAPAPLDISLFGRCRSRLTAHSTALRGPDGCVKVYPVAGGTPRDLPLAAGEYPVEWTTDGEGMFVVESWTAPQRIFRLDLTTRKCELWLEVAVSQMMGTRLSQVLLTRDGRSYVRTNSQLLSDLCLAERVR